MERYRVVCLVFLTFILCAGCSFNVSRTINGTLQDTRSGEVKMMTIKTEGEPRSGTFTGTTVGGETFKGRYTAMVGGYNYGPNYNISQQGQVSDQNANVTMIGVSDKDTSLNCQLLSSRSLMNPHGRGMCSDSIGRTYNVVF
jgi:uncharacterized protein YceK